MNTLFQTIMAKKPGTLGAVRNSKVKKYRHLHPCIFSTLGAQGSQKWLVSLIALKTVGSLFLFLLLICLARFNCYSAARALDLRKIGRLLAVCFPVGKNVVKCFRFFLFVFKL